MPAPPEQSVGLCFETYELYLDAECRNQDAECDCDPVRNFVAYLLAGNHVSQSRSWGYAKSILTCNLHIFLDALQAGQRWQQQQKEAQLRHPAAATVQQERHPTASAERSAAPHG